MGKTARHIFSYPTDPEGFLDLDSIHFEYVSRPWTSFTDWKQIPQFYRSQKERKGR